MIAFDFGVFDRKTALPLELTWEGKLLHRGWVTVFEPNRGRLNRRPMWFSVEDQELNNAPAENALHASWLPLLGVVPDDTAVTLAAAEGIEASLAGFTVNCGSRISGPA